MPRKTKPAPNQSPLFWEADQMDLQSYVDSRLVTAESMPDEPGWFSEAFDASWPLAFSEAEAWCR